MIAPRPVALCLSSATAPNTGCGCGGPCRTGWPAGPVPIKPLYWICGGSRLDPVEQTLTEYVPPTGVSYLSVASTAPSWPRISPKTLLSADADETSISMREGPLTGTGRAASQPPFGTLPERELVPARAPPARIEGAAA